MVRISDFGSRGRAVRAPLGSPSNNQLNSFSLFSFSAPKLTFLRKNPNKVWIQLMDTQEKNCKQGFSVKFCCTRVIAINVIYRCLKKAFSKQRVDTKLKTNVF